MTGQQIVTMFETIIDDSPDSTLELALLNAAKNEIETLQDWNFNRALDASNTVGASDTYLTAKTLPTTFLTPRKIYFSGDLTPLILIPFEERERYKDAYKRYYIDWLNRTFSICGASGSAGKTINIFFAQQTPDLTLVSSPVWPSAYHAILGFKMAEMWQAGSDGDDLNFRMSAQNLRLASNLLRAMKVWDARIKTMEYNDKNARNVDLASYPNVVGQDYLY